MNDFDCTTYYGAFQQPEDDIIIDTPTYSVPLGSNNSLDYTIYRHSLEPSYHRVDSEIFSPASMIGHAFPNAPCDINIYSPTDYLWDPYRSSCSPSDTSLDFNYPDSGIGDCPGTPWSSSEISSDALYMRSGHVENFNSVYATHPLSKRPDAAGRHACVTMQDIQGLEDASFDDKISFDDGSASYGSVYGTYAQEGYQPMGAEEDAANIPRSIPSSNAQASSYAPSPVSSPPVTRSRRNRDNSQGPSTAASFRVTKPSPSSKRRSPTKSDPNTPEASHTRVFPCPLAPYGCPSSQGSKNEWKRHMNTQHMRPGVWRCDQCDSSNNKDFNRKDLFSQHVKRMHAELLSPSEHQHSSTKKTTRNKSSASPNHDMVTDEEVLAAMAQRCYQQTRATPAESGCLFCDDKFSGKDTWDQRMEHVGKHLEMANKPGSAESTNTATWRVDKGVENWMLKEGILVRRGNGIFLSDARS